MVYSEVLFPCDITQWGDVKSKLQHIASESHTLSARLLVNKLGDVHGLIPAPTLSAEGKKQQERR